MTKILKIKSKRPPHKGLIISAPLWYHEYMTLYCLAKRITKTKIIRTHLDEWIKEHRLTDTDESLITEIADGYSEEFSNDIRFKEVSLEDYKMEISQELMAKGVKPLYVQSIVAKVKAV